jgi:predicted Rossmann fold flavoprotein
MKVLIIGGGPAGMLAAISAKEEGYEVTLLEKNNRLGKKLSITGKGRCNITSSLDISEFIENIPGNGRFLYSAFENFDNKDILKLLNIPTKNERGNRIFPVSDRAEDVVETLKRKLDGVNVIYGEQVKKILVKDIKENEDEANAQSEKTENEKHSKKEIKYNKEVYGVKTQDRTFETDKVIIATGGMSYPGTGSTGDGYELAKECGHTITQIRPSLTAMTVTDESLEICQELQGLTLKNVAIKVLENGKKVYDDFGEMLFTHFGISGPTVLSASAHLVRTKMKNPIFEIDLKPGLTEEKLNDRIIRDFDKYKNKEIKNSLNDLLPKAMIPVAIKVSKIDEDKKVNEITREERFRLVDTLKHFKIKISGFRPVKEAIITAGGVSTKEINPKTMESKIIKGLYFAGEVIDVDAYTGGFNLQIAYSTGYTAGKCKEN